MGLNTRKYGLLGHIRGTPGIPFSELARRSRITVQSVHTAVSGFVDDGTAHAGSASSLRITPAGEDILSRAAGEVDRRDTEFTETLQLVNDGALVVDVRRDFEWNRVHIPDAVHMRSKNCPTGASNCPTTPS